MIQYIVRSDNHSFNQSFKITKDCPLLATEIPTIQLNSQLNSLANCSINRQILNTVNIYCTSFDSYNLAALTCISLAISQITKFGVDCWMHRC